MTVGFYCYLTAAVSNAVLVWILLATSRTKRRGIWLLLACSAMVIWALALALQEVSEWFPPSWIWTLESLHLFAWLWFFSQLLRHGQHPGLLGQPDRIRKGILSVTLLQISYIWLSPTLGQEIIDTFEPANHLYGQIGLAVVGLVMIEQFYRNSRIDQRWRIKFLCLAAGTLFLYDFYLYSDGLLGDRVRPDLWAARGAIVALLPPLIGISAARNPDWAVDIFISRHVVFHSVTILGAGSYLLIMATASYYLKVYGGEWGTVLQVIFMGLAFIGLLIVLFSGQIRSEVRVFLNKNFFNYAYDYRQEWLRLVATLSDSDSGLLLDERVILALGEIVESPSGMLFSREQSGQFLLRATYGDPNIDMQEIGPKDPLIAIMQSGFVVNLMEMKDRTDLYDDLAPPAWLEQNPNAWLLIPLHGKFHQIESVVLLTKARSEIGWNWEIIDMIKTTSRLCASYLALEDAARKLAEAQQFDGFNRLSAFVIHDLKNLIAQLSLVVRNADKHRDNPEFIKDMILTIQHAVEKMNALMSQLRNSSPAAAIGKVELGGVIAEVIEARSRQLPVPQYLGTLGHTWVLANRDRLGSALEHIIHNAQDASGKNGTVLVDLAIEGQKALISVKDNGSGMDEQFIRTRLFKPFETTKGLAGMGIGAYESREYARSLGGDLLVQSDVGTGSIFTFRIPLAIADISSYERGDRFGGQ
jgi:putative PEP-CTERM system histidine kinase